MRPFAVRALLWKELRQVGRNRTALLTAAFLPFVILFVAPIQVLLQLRLVGSRGLPTNVPLPGMESGDPMQLLLHIVYPLLFVIGGLLLPSLTTTYAIVAERERRSLELLVSLPVSVIEILAAKLGMVLVVTALVGLPYLAVVFTVLLILGVASAPDIPALLAPFVAAVVCSTAMSLLLTLLARDFRSANNLNGALFVPVIFISAATLFLIAPSGSYVLSIILLALAVATLFIAKRWVTFERYLE
ncbi:MAG TPA: ABC transporter permease [Candidatus Limnocylindrales bacterium]|nr:ABC transporter permease [Candidatus Limnocylindrales bacterium]